MCILVAFYYIALQEGDIVSVWIWGDLFEELMYAHYLVAVLSIPPFYFFSGIRTYLQHNCNSFCPQSRLYAYDYTSHITT